MLFAMLAEACQMKRDMLINNRKRKPWASVGL